jgi:hypothetical protein
MKSTLFVLSTIGLLILLENRQGNEEEPMHVVMSTQMGRPLRMTAAVQPYMQLVNDCVGEFDRSTMEILILAYSTKTELADAPYTKEEALILVRHRDPIRFTFILAYRMRDSFENLVNPTHMSKFRTKLEMDSFDSNELRDFAESSRFAFYDFDIAKSEFLYVASNYAHELSFLTKPLSNSERRGRMELFVAPHFDP